MRGFVGDRARRERLVELVRSGVSAGAAADQVGLTRSWGYQVLRRAGLGPASTRDGVDPALLTAAFERVGTLRAAARECGIGKDLARRILVEQGVQFPERARSKPLERLRFHELLAQGWPVTKAAREVGASRRTGLSWADGGRMIAGKWRPATPAVIIDATGRARYEEPVADTARTCHLNLTERCTIADLRTAGLSCRQIAVELGRSPSTISREIARHSDDQGRYQPHAGDLLAAANRARPKQGKLVAEGPLRAAVENGLDQQWSPEQIAARLRAEHPDDESMHVCHETIYQAIYLQARGGLKREVQQALRSGRTRRKPRRRFDQRTKRFIEPMVMIADRPAEVADRAVPGHWEGDLIIGTGHTSAIGTLVERTTRFVMLVHLPERHDAESVRDGLISTMGTLPDHLRRSLTWDQGSEMALHGEFSLAADIDVYFCNPGSPWQRGSNENTNGLLRQYFPKSTDLGVHTVDDLQFVADRLNGRPRKTLDWETPAERMQKLLQSTAA